MSSVISDKTPTPDNYFNEQYNHKIASKNELLETLVEEDMINRGLNPKDPLQVKHYWKLQGVLSING